MLLLICSLSSFSDIDQARWPKWCQIQDTDTMKRLKSSLKEFLPFVGLEVSCSLNNGAYVVYVGP